MQTIIKISGGISRNPAYRLRNPVDLSINENECIAIVGDNGSGKSMLVDMLTEKHPLLNNNVEYDFSPSILPKVYNNIKHISFMDTYGTVEGTYYYQQRWNQTEIESYPTVAELIDEAFQHSGTLLNSEHSLSEEYKRRISLHRRQSYEHLYDVFDIKSIEQKKIVMLSSGEQRKFQLTKALVSNPRVLVVDNPFIGLDASSRRQLYLLLKTLVEEMGILLILVISKTDDMPDFVTHVIELDNMFVKSKVTKSEWEKTNTAINIKVLDGTIEQEIIDLPALDDAELEKALKTSPVIDFHDVTVRYGNRLILDKLNLTVYNGEHWALKGKNGSGKSTLLSIVFADNPQAYSNDIILFGKKRGTGESIWDIKKHIGYISPEMHRAYLKEMPAMSIVASGLRDTIGLYIKPKEEQMDICRFWMKVFGIEQYATTNFMHLSNGEQRLVLLARAFVKDPSLLILDEPLHGLDMKNRQLVKDVIKTFVRRKNKTLIMVTHYDNDLPDIIDRQLTLQHT